MYPQNQKYIVVPIENIATSLSNVLSICRKSLDKKFMIWNYNEKDKILDNFKKDVKIKILSHADALKLMATKEWSKPEVGIEA